MLSDHHQAAGQLAEGFAQAFGAGDWGRLAGLWHDLGKYSADFQAYIRGGDGDAAHLEGLRGKVDHSAAGAVHALKLFDDTSSFAARALAYCIAGHHAGLADWKTDSEASLARRLARDKPETLDALKQAPEAVLKQPPPAMPKLTAAASDAEVAFQAGMFIRMVFSCLTDADFLDTEGFMSPQRGQDRLAPQPTLAQLDAALDRHLADKLAHADNSEVNRHRRAVLDACRDAAGLEPGFFSLTVPTGGGKTFSSLSFALKHALKHARRFGHSRIIYAIPFTSIIEQNAQVIRKAFADLGQAAVLEHHSNLEPRHETPWTRTACENWDAPLIVTTNVQFFESLFAARGSRCRKLHNLVGSVIILDEAQTIPVDLLHPCLAALRELVLNYRCTIVLCTATQPAIHKRSDFDIGIDGVRKIIRHPEQLYADMRRVEVSHLGPCGDDDLARRMIEQPQALCIVNTKRHAVDLFKRLSQAGDAFHLSTNMCPRHRSAVLRLVKRRLTTSRPCRLVSTSLIEAGVDIDFPVVYRAMAGIDAIAQAAGRCNREGKRHIGQVYVFDPDAEHPTPPGYMKQTADTTRELVGLCGDLLAPKTVERYFQLHYWKKQSAWDKNGVMDCFKPDEGRALLCDFRTAAERFQMIPEQTHPVIIPYGRQGRQCIARLKAAGHPDREQLRRLQRYTAQVSEGLFLQLQSQGVIEWLYEQIPVLFAKDVYRDDTGVSPGDGSMIL